MANPKSLCVLCVSVANLKRSLRALCLCGQIPLWLRGSEHTRRAAQRVLHVGVCRQALEPARVRTGPDEPIGPHLGVKVRHGRAFGDPGAPLAPSRTEAPPVLRASGASASSTQAVSLPSSTRCTRSQVVNGSCRSARAGTPPASKTTSPKPPADTTRLSALIAARHGGFGLAAHPQQLVQPHALRGGGGRVKRVAHIHHRGQFALAGGLRQQPVQHRRAARETSADQLRNLAARHAAAQRGVERRARRWSPADRRGARSGAGG